MKAVFLTAIVLSSVSLSFGQGFPPVTGETTHTNILTPVPLSGTLLIDYDFLAIPDTVDVYYDGTNIFSSGLVNGSGQFVVPYGPGLSHSLMIIMDQTSAPPGTIWSYTPSLADSSQPGPTASLRVSQVEICWDTVTNAWYQLRYRSTLTTNQWVPLTGAWLPGTGGMCCTNDAVQAGQSQRFYQVAVTNSPPEP
jgi:hypothetical protein